MMKRRNLIRIMSLILCFVILGSAPVYAAQSRMSEQIQSCWAFLSRSNGNLNINLSIAAVNVVDKVGITTVVIYRYTGTYWTTENTFTSQSYPSFMASDVSSHSISFSYAPLYPTASYYISATFYAQNSSGSSTRICSSNVV